MPTDDEMTLAQRRKHLRLLQPRFRQAGRSERSRMLDEMEIVAGLHCKSLRRLMGQDLARRPRRRQCGPSYGHWLDPVLRAVAEAVDYVCAERVQPNLAWLAKDLAQQGELDLAPDQPHQLARMSVSTLRRRLQRLSQDQPRLPRTRPQPASRASYGESLCASVAFRGWPGLEQVATGPARPIPRRNRSQEARRSLPPRHITPSRRSSPSSTCGLHSSC